MLERKHAEVLASISAEAKNNRDMLVMIVAKLYDKDVTSVAAEMNTRVADLKRSVLTYLTTEGNAPSAVRGVPAGTAKADIAKLTSTVRSKPHAK